MIYSALLLCLVSLGQSSPKLSASGIPLDATIFTVTFEEGRDVVVANAAVRVYGQFIGDSSEMENVAAVELVYDTPWSPVPAKKVLKQNIREFEPEPRFQRDQRYEKSGYTALESENGTTWIARTTIDRAERAQELRRALEEKRDVALAAYTASPAAGAESGGRVGFNTLWGRHIAIAVCAAALILLTAKVCF